MPPASFEALLVSARSLSPSVRELVFARADGTRFDFEPGQWVNLVLSTEGEEIRRAYSIASAPREEPTFDVAVTRVEAGAASPRLHAIAPGESVRVVGPQGFFVRPALGSPPALFIGTGSGLAPLRSMLHAALARDARTPVWLLFGGRAEHDLLYRDELEALAARHPNFRFEATLSRGGPDWAGRRGYVQAHASELLTELAAATDEPPHVYACGLERMVSAVRSLVRQDLGLPRQRVHTERYD